MGCLSYQMLANAASFQSFEQSAATMGTANAGTTVTDDASIQYYNPAGMAFVDVAELAVSGILVNGSFEFDPFSFTNLRGQPVQGNTNGPSDSSFAPAFYYIQPINDRFTVGFGLTAPFGLSTTYDDLSVARYFATRSQLETVDLNPSFGAKITKNFSFGAGFDAVYIKAKLDQAFDFGSFVEQLPDNPSFVKDAFIRNTADTWGFGWNAGFFYQYSPRTKFGLAYHSRINVSPSGRSRVLEVGGVPIEPTDVRAVADSIGLHDSNVTTNTIKLPDYVTFSAEQDLTNIWKLMFDAEFIHWNSVQKIVLNFSGNPIVNQNTPANRNLPPSTLQLNYHNTWRFALGQSIQLTPRWLIRTGVAFDGSPVSEQFRDARIPDSDRYWADIGANFKFTKRFNVDLSYSHVFFKDSSIDKTFSPAKGFSQELVADYSGHANLYGVQLNYNFG